MSALHHPHSHCTASHQAAPATRTTPLRHSKGFSLVECCAVLVVLSVLASAAVGGSGGLLQRQWDKRLTGLGAAQLQAALNVARSEAIKSAGRAVLCPSADGLRCAEAGGWSQGWMVFRDDNNDAQRDEGESVVAVYPAMAAKLQVNGNTSISRYVSFQPDGAAATAGGAFQAGTFTVCRGTGEADTAQQIVLSATGRTRQQPATGAACA